MTTNLLPTGIPPSAHPVLVEWLDDLQVVCNPLILGVYLTGSIPLRDFHEHKSDIDFIVLLTGFPDPPQQKAIAQMHRRLQHHYPKPDLSGIYLTPNIIASETPVLQKVLSFHENSFGFLTFDMAPITLFELKTNSITLFGIPSTDLLIHQKAGSVDAFMYANMHTYWKSWIDSHSSWLAKKTLLYLFPRFTEWSILGMGRQWYTLETGKIISKTDVGPFLLSRLSSAYENIIRQALEIRRDTRSYPLVRTYAIRPSMTRCSETLTCLQMILTEFSDLYMTKWKQDENLSIGSP